MITHTAVIIDDEQAAHYALQVLLKRYDNIKIIGQAYNGQQAIEIINRLEPDLIFLDIEMPDMNGFDVIKKLTHHQPYIVFCTAYDQYAIDAFKQKSIDYLLKPVDEERFEQCIQKIKHFISRPREFDMNELIKLSHIFNPPKKASAIPISIKSKIIFVRCEQITYCVAKDGYISLMTDEGKEYVSDLTLKQLEERLPEDFMRVQKSYIVNKLKIAEIYRYLNNRLILVMDDHNKTKITTGTSYIDNIRKELQL